MGTVHMKVAAVLRFMDAVLEKRVVRGEIRLQIRQQNKILWKAADCAVILEQPGVERIDLCISGEIYQDMQLHIEMSDAKMAQIHTVWLAPSRKYPFTEDMAVLRGTCAQKDLYALRQLEASQCKLMETMQVGDDCIRLWGFKGIVENRMLALCEEKRWEIITLVGPAPDIECGYLVKERLSRSFHKGNTKVYIAARINTDSSGNFTMAYINIAQSGEQIQFLYRGNETFCIDINGGQEYLINLKEISCREGT